MNRPAEVTEYLRCGGANCDNACATQFDRIGVEDCKTWRVHGYVQQLEERIVHLEALNQQNLSVITMQERTRARLAEQISQLEALVPRWISVEDEQKPRHGQNCLCICALPNDPEHKWDWQSVRWWNATAGNGYVDRPHFSDEGVEGMTVTHWMPLPKPPKEEHKE